MRNKFIYLALMLSFAFSANAANLINSGKEFENFLTVSKNQPQEQVEKNWEVFESNYQSIYDSNIYRKDDGDWEKRLRAKRDRFFTDLPKLSSKMINLFNKAQQIVTEKEAQFKEVFPDLKSDIPVIFLPSLGSFNGQVDFLKDYGRTGLLIGVDFIAERNDDLTLLFSHEFFHAYHSDKLVGDVDKTMASPLWKEGFATYVSGLLNPHASDEALLMQADLAVACSKPEEVKKMAAEFLEVINNDDLDTYKNWFWMSGTTQPVRRGYCLGLQVIREIVKTNNVQEMTKWNETYFSAEIQKVLNKMVKE